MSKDVRRSNDWSHEADLLRDELERSWQVRTSENYLVAQKIANRQLRIWEVTAVYTPRRDGLPGQVTTLMSVEPQFLAAVDRARYFAYYNLWEILQALDHTTRPQP